MIQTIFIEPFFDAVLYGKLVALVASNHHCFFSSLAFVPLLYSRPQRKARAKDGRK
jgi:hypothetical protein